MHKDDLFIVHDDFVSMTAKEEKKTGRNRMVTYIDDLIPSMNCRTGLLIMDVL